MAHWNYGKMTIKTWVELCPDFEFVFFEKKIKIHLFKLCIFSFSKSSIFKTDLKKRKKYVLQVEFEPGTYCLLILCSTSELTGIVVNVQKNQI